MTLLKIEELVNIGLSKKWGMLKVYNCIDLSVHPCTALSSDTFCIGKYYTFHCTGKVILGQKKAKETKKLKKNYLLQNKPI